MSSLQTKVTGSAPRARSMRNALRMPVTSFMTKEVVAVALDEDLEALAQLMLNRGVSRVPVIGPVGQLAGIVSKTDLVRDHLRSPQATRAEQVMATPVLSLSESATVGEAARLMSTQGVHGAPVVSAAGKLVGWLSALDVLGWVASLH